MVIPNSKTIKAPIFTNNITLTFLSALLKMQILTDFFQILKINLYLKKLFLDQFVSQNDKLHPFQEDFPRPLGLLVSFLK